MATDSPLAHEEPKATRRDFIYVASASVAAVAVAGGVWPLINQMNPDASVLALSTTEVDLSNVAEGSSATFIYRGSPVIVRHRTAAEIEEARAEPMSALIDPATDESRIKEGHDQWLVLIGLCTHLGCIPIGNAGDAHGWTCPCHGSKYDASGRVIKGPAPKNLVVPPYEFLSDTKILIG